MNTINKDSLLSFIHEIEQAHFRTEHDTGANLNARLLWNALRRYAGLPHIRAKDLRYYDEARDEYIYRPDSVLNQPAPAQPAPPAEGTSNVIERAISLMDKDSPEEAYELLKKHAAISPAEKSQSDGALAALHKLLGVVRQLDFSFGKVQEEHIHDALNIAIEEAETALIATPKPAATLAADEDKAAWFSWYTTFKTEYGIPADTKDAWHAACAYKERQTSARLKDKFGALIACNASLELNVKQLIDENTQLEARLKEAEAKLAREDAEQTNLIDQRDRAEEAADKLASLVLGEPIDWADHDAKWQEAINQIEDGFEEKSYDAKAAAEQAVAKERAIIAKRWAESGAVKAAYPMKALQRDGYPDTAEFLEWLHARLTQAEAKLAEECANHTKATEHSGKLTEQLNSVELGLRVTKDALKIFVEKSEKLEAEIAETDKDIAGVLEECAKEITLSNDFPWAEEVHCAFRALRTGKEQAVAKERAEVLACLMAGNASMDMIERDLNKAGLYELRDKLRQIAYRLTQPSNQSGEAKA